MEVIARTQDGRLENRPARQTTERNRMLRIGHRVSRRVANPAGPISHHTVVFLSGLRENAPAGGSRPHFVLEKGEVEIRPTTSCLRGWLAETMG